MAFYANHPHIPEESEWMSTFNENAEMIHHHIASNNWIVKMAQFNICPHKCPFKFPLKKDGRILCKKKKNCSKAFNTWEDFKQHVRAFAKEESYNMRGEDEDARCHMILLRYIDALET